MRSHVRQSLQVGLALLRHPELGGRVDRCVSAFIRVVRRALPIDVLVFADVLRNQ